MKNCIPSHLFIDILLQKLSSCYVWLSDWLTAIFVIPWETQEYLFIINLFTSLLQMKLFLRNNIALSDNCTVKESISCTIFFLAAVRLRPKAAVWSGSGKYVLLYDEKSL